MGSPLQNSPDPDPATDHLGSFRLSHRRPPHAVAVPPADVAAADLRRLESSVQWLVRQGKMARFETGRGRREEIRKLPRAMPLPPVPGLPPVQTEGSGHKTELSAFRLVPPLPRERLQLPRGQHRHAVRGALFLLAAGMIAGSIAYHISAGGAFSAWDPAHASAFDRNDRGRWQAK
jgi:hypothetical protein